jgi:zinc protease
MVRLDELKGQNSLPGPQDIFRKTLPNGITILTRSNFNSPSVVVSGYVAAGSNLDPADKLGLANFTATALMRGTQSRSFQEIFNDLESVGASLGFGASVHNTSFSGRSLSEDLPLLVKILSDCLRNPVFPPDYFSRLQAQLLTSLAIRAQETSEMAALTFDKLLFDQHPYGVPEDGFTETIQKIKRGDLVDFHKKYYRPQGMVVVVVGAVYTQQVFEVIESELGTWQNSLPEPQFTFPVIHAPTKTIKQHIELAGKSQTDLIMGTIGPKRCSPDFLSASLGNSVLGQFGMMGRIGEVVREKAGLAYDASTSLNAWIEGGSWEVTAGVNPANLDKAIDLIIRELQRFTKEPVTAEELADSQANYIGRLPLTLESNAGVAGTILNLERFELGFDYLQRYNSLVNEVTPARALETARKYIDPDKLVIVSSGTTPAAEA